MYRNLCSTDNRDSFNETLNGSIPCVNDTGNVEKGANNGGRGSLGYRNLPCGYCDANCVYNAVEISLFIGVLANALVIIRVAKDKKLRDPTFIGIAALALPDLLFLLHNLTISFETVIISYTCQPPKILSRPWYILNSMIWFSANSHVAFLAVLRYLTIAYPIKSSIYLTPKRVMLLSAGVWTLGILLLGTLAGLITLKIVLPGTSGEFIIIWWITVYLIPLIVTTILHILKICRVKKASKASATGHTRRSYNRMAKIVPLVIIMATVLPLPKLVFNCIRTISKNGNEIFPSENFKIHFKGVSQIVYLINHLINPFIYGFLSKKFRKGLKEMLLCFKPNHRDRNVFDARSNAKCPRTRISSTDTMPYSISSISSVESQERHETCYRVSSFDSEKSNNRKSESVSSYESADSSRNVKRF